MYQDKLFQRQLKLLLLLVLVCWSYLYLTSPALAKSSYQDQIQDKITEFSLDNGLRFIILENHQAPVISFVTYANVGGVDEPSGKTGVAHFLEHLAFKGTQLIGTTNYEQEKLTLDQLDNLFEQIQQAKKMGDLPELTELEAKFKQIAQEAAQYVNRNEYGQIVETAGGTGLNAVTTPDYTAYFYSFPANKLELWMSLESERFLQPVFREFYQEKDVILEERRLRTDNSAIGQMIEAFLSTAFEKHPYQRPVIGYNQDIVNLTRKDVQEFFNSYYGANNIIIAIAGDVDPQQVQNLARIYFESYQPQQVPATEIIKEPPQLQPRSMSLELASQPWYLEGYHRPDLNHPDAPIYEIISRLLTEGRASRLYLALVEQQLALAVQTSSSFPGNKYPSLVLIYVLTAPNHSVSEVETVLRDELNRLQQELVSEEELEKVKTRIKTDFWRATDSNLGMARLLAEYEAKTGNWETLFQELDKLAAVTPEDVQRVAQITFTTNNRTVGRLLSANN